MRIGGNRNEKHVGVNAKLLTAIKCLIINTLMKIILLSVFFAAPVLAVSTNEIRMAELKVGTNTTYKKVTLTKKSPLYAVARYDGGIAKVKIEDIANLPEPLATEWKTDALVAKRAIEEEAQKALAAKKAEEEAERTAWQQEAERRVETSGYARSQSAAQANHPRAAAATGMALLIVLGCLYFLPSIVASSNKHRNTAGIVILNLFLGWTLLGWVVALIWSVSNQKPATS